MTSSSEDETSKIPMKFKLFKLYDFNVYDGFTNKLNLIKLILTHIKILQIYYPNVSINFSGQTASILVEDLIHSFMLSWR